MKNSNFNLLLNILENQLRTQGENKSGIYNEKQDATAYTKSEGYVYIEQYPKYHEEEMVLHYDFALQLLNYILKISIERKEYPQQVVKKELSRITFNQCVGGMAKVCEIIDFDYNRLVETDKFKLLKRRFKNGLDYLV